MEIKIPEYQPSYEPRITQAAYEKLRARAQNRIDRALLILRKYHETGDDALYELFTLTTNKLYQDIRLLLLATRSHWFVEQAFKLQAAAEVVEEKPRYYPAMIFDLSGCLSGY